METNKNIQKGTCKMKSETGYCPRPIEEASESLSKKWVISILITINNFKKLRFNQLLERLEKPTSKILSMRLKELEKEKLIKRKSYNEIPPRVEYSLTNSGKELVRCLLPLIHWAEKRN